MGALMAEKLDDTNGWSKITLSVPPELAGYVPSLIRFFDAMIFKLRRNAHKGRWEAVPLGRAMSGLRGEAVELEEAIKHGNTSEVLMESADVANQALIVAEIALEVRE